MSGRDDDDGEWKFSTEDLGDQGDDAASAQARQVAAGGGQRAQDPDGFGIAGLEFTTREVLDLAVAWVALGIAFTAFGWGPLFGGEISIAVGVAVSLLTVGVGFLLHELAHKVVAVRFGQIAHFRADYGMLLLAVVAGFAGFLFAAPGAVYHRGRITKRQNGLIALAGPVTNLALMVAFVPFVLLPGPLFLVGVLGVTINAVLAAFNMLPFGPLDGNTVRKWSWAVHVPVFLLSLGAAAFVIELFFGVFGVL